MKNLPVILLATVIVAGIGIGIAGIIMESKEEVLTTDDTTSLEVPIEGNSDVEEMIVVDEDSDNSTEEQGVVTTLDESTTVMDRLDESTGSVSSISKASGASVTTGENSRVYVNPEHGFSLSFPNQWSAEFVELNEYLVQIDRQDPDQYNPGSGSAYPNQAYLTVNAFTEEHESYESVQELLTSGTSLESNENDGTAPSSDTIIEEADISGNGITGKLYTRESSNGGNLVNTLVTGYTTLPSGTIIMLKGGVGNGPDSSFLIPELKEIIRSIAE